MQGPCTIVSVYSHERIILHVGIGARSQERYDHITQYIHTIARYFMLKRHAPSHTYTLVECLSINFPILSSSIVSEHINASIIATLPAALCLEDLIRSVRLGPPVAGGISSLPQFLVRSLVPEGVSKCGIVGRAS
jgi:hypothetical protein